MSFHEELPKTRSFCPKKDSMVKVVKFCALYTTIKIMIVLLMPLIFVYIETVPKKKCANISSNTLNKMHINSHF